MPSGGLRGQANARKDGDVVFNGQITVNSGIKTYASGVVIPGMTVISQVIDFAAAGSGINGIPQLSFAFTSGPAGTIGSGDYIIPLTQPAESGFNIFPATATSADTITVNAIATAAINPAAGAFKFLVIKQTGV